MGYKRLRNDLDEYQNILKRCSVRTSVASVDRFAFSKKQLILQGSKERYENHHNVHMMMSLKAAVIYSSRYIQSRELPDKAIDLMDESAAKFV